MPINEFGEEYWKARELMTVLGYTKWENFKKVIDKAMLTCKLSGNDIKKWFPDDRKPIENGKGKVQFILDYHLSRYACYLIVQNADSRKKIVALGQTYFAIKTRQMELTEEKYKNLTEDKKRLYTRLNIKNKNKHLFETAKNSGVINYSKFNDYGYKGLYGG